MAGIRDNLARQDVEQPQPMRVPVNFDNQDDFLRDMRTKYEWGYSFNEHNVIAGKEDAKFTVGNQWDPVVEARRKLQKKPVLTFNRLVAFMAQLVGNRLMNETEIRVFPDKAGTKEIANIREGLIRNIFKNSNADFARDEAGKYQVVCGEGYFTLCMEYASDDVFEQEIKLQAVVDPYSVVLDPLSIEPSGEDAQWGFVGDDIPQQEFKAVALGGGSQFPWSKNVESVRFLDAGRYRPDCVVLAHGHGWGQSPSALPGRHRSRYHEQGRIRISSLHRNTVGRLAFHPGSAQPLRAALRLLGQCDP
jgi:hypothetical protein